jgi:hypothetical protein
MRKAITEAAALSARDRALLEFLATAREDGRPHTITEAAAAFGITHQRVSQIRHSPPGQKYLLLRAGRGRLDLHLWTLGELRRRVEHAAAIPLADLLALFKATMPAEPILHVHEVRGHAERIADELGLTGEARRKLIHYALERARRAR